MHQGYWVRICLHILVFNFSNNQDGNTINGGKLHILDIMGTMFVHTASQCIIDKLTSQSLAAQSTRTLTVPHRNDVRQNCILGDVLAGC